MNLFTLRIWISRDEAGFEIGWIWVVLIAFAVWWGLS